MATALRGGLGLMNLLGGSKHEYSTEEQIVGKWIDGKPVYEKTIVVTNPAKDWTQASFNISGLSDIVAFSLVGVRSNGDKITEFYRSSSDRFEVHLKIINTSTTGDLIYYCQAGSDLVSFFVILQYTKMAD